MLTVVTRSDLTNVLVVLAIIAVTIYIIRSLLK